MQAEPFNFGFFSIFEPLINTAARMNDLVLKSINEILFENGEIILPGLGVFETHHKEAQIDQVQGFVHPPAREIVLYENKTKEDSTFKTIWFKVTV
ncbi:MAG: hypothetical protein R2784_15395 [Saprospiraceae bacterium]